MIMNGILDALEILHKNDIIHRDVKPKNIIIKNNGDAVLIDYGIARVISENGGNDTEHLGTVGYAAPEQFGFAPSDYKTDIYAFGITMKRVTANSGASFLIGNIIKKCTEFDPSRRYQSVQNIQARFNFYIRILPTLIFTILFALTIFMAVFTFYKKTGDSEIVRNVSDNIQNIIEYSPLTYIQSDNIQYMQFIDNGNYEDNIVLEDNMPETHISVKKCDENITVIVDDKYTFKFIPDKAKPTDLYKNGKLYGEIVFYDFNEDGILEIIPVLSNAIISNVYSDFDMFFLKNYVKGWCIYLNSKNEFVLAEGEMCAAYETLYFYENMPGCIYTDDLCYYTFDKGYIIYNE